MDTRGFLYKFRFPTTTKWLVFLWWLMVAVFLVADRRVAVLAGCVAALEDAARFVELSVPIVESEALDVPHCLECSDGVFV